MFVIAVDIVAALLVSGGIALLVRQPDRSSAARPAEEGSDPGAYARRIAGTMIAAFGLAIGMMVTVFHFAGG